MLVDFHVHAYPPALAGSVVRKLRNMSYTETYTDGTVRALRSSMAQCGIEYSLVLPVATSEHQVVKINTVSARLNVRARETGVLSFGSMHPGFTRWKEELARIKELGLPGVKLHPIWQGTDFDDPRYLRILDRAAELGLIVLCHGGKDIGFPGRDHCTPAMVLRAVREVGDFPLIMAHMGGWHHWDEVEELLADTSVFLDTAYCLGEVHPTEPGHYAPEDLPMLSSEQFMRMVRTFGSKRIFWGTDSPWREQKESLNLILQQPLTKEEREDILGGNARRLLGLEERIPPRNTAEKAEDDIKDPA